MQGLDLSISLTWILFVVPVTPWRQCEFNPTFQSRIDAVFRIIPYIIPFASLSPGGEIGRRKGLMSLSTHGGKPLV
jgi:hypothetical protein